MRYLVTLGNRAYNNTLSHVPGNVMAQNNAWKRTKQCKGSERCMPTPRQPAPAVPFDNGLKCRLNPRPLMKRCPQPAKRLCQRHAHMPACICGAGVTGDLRLSVRAAPGRACMEAEQPMHGRSCCRAGLCTSNAGHAAASRIAGATALRLSVSTAP